MKACPSTASCRPHVPRRLITNRPRIRPINPKLNHSNKSLTTAINQLECYNSSAEASSEAMSLDALTPGLLKPQTPRGLALGIVHSSPRRYSLRTSLAIPTPEFGKLERLAITSLTDHHCPLGLDSPAACIHTNAPKPPSQTSVQSSRFLKLCRCCLPSSRTRHLSPRSRQEPAHARSITLVGPRGKLHFRNKSGARSSVGTMPFVPRSRMLLLSLHPGSSRLR